jgi:hypothetical protein
MVLTNPIEEQNIVDRFAAYVVATANSGIAWGTNAVPFAEFSTAYFGGTTGGKGIGISGANIFANPIQAATIYNTLVAETNAYTRIRYMRALLFVEGPGGNTGTKPTPGYVFDATAIANMNTGYLQNIGSPSNGGVSSGQTVTSSGLETLFNNLRNSYNNARLNTTTIQINVCHASCHSSCHASRSRR